MTKNEECWIRLYLQVHVEFLKDGTMLPRSFIWTDGRTYEIDRVLHVQPAPARKSGGQGDRYELQIKGQIRYLFFEHNADYGNMKVGRWFMEWKDDTHGAA